MDVYGLWSSIPLWESFELDHSESGDDHPLSEEKRPHIWGKPQENGGLMGFNGI